MTSLLGGKQVPKNHLRVSAYGALDELGAWVGLCRLDADEALKEELAIVLRLIFHCGYDMSLPPNETSFKITKEDVAWLEQKIDGYGNRLPKTFRFALGTDSLLGAKLNVARTMCRKAERDMVALMQEEPIHEEALIFVNRLSDYFFALFQLMGKSLFYGGQSF